MTKIDKANEIVNFCNKTAEQFEVIGNFEKMVDYEAIANGVAEALMLIGTEECTAEHFQLITWAAGLYDAMQLQTV